MTDDKSENRPPAEEVEEIEFSETEKSKDSETAEEDPLKEDVDIEQTIDFREKYLGELADKENMRKRLLREQNEVIRLAAERSALEILAPLDQFETALTFARSMSDEVKNWAVGFEMIHAQFKEWLSRQGIISFSSLGEMFTPTSHEAVERIVDNGKPEGTILKEFTKGYRGKQRVIRPARVAVCVHVKAQNSEQSSAENNDEIDHAGQTSTNQTPNNNHQE